MSKEICLITYPRCGSTYLFNIFTESFKKNIFRSHLYTEAQHRHYEKNNYIVTLLRNPLDAISSIVSLEAFYFSNENNFEKIIDFTIKDRIKNYETFFSIVPKFSNLILNYEDINLYKNNIVEYVSDESGNKIIKYDYNCFIEDNSEAKFLKSSQNYDRYEYIKQKVFDSDLTKSFNIYNNLITECKIFK